MLGKGVRGHLPMRLTRNWFLNVTHRFQCVHVWSGSRHHSRQGVMAQPWTGGHLYARKTEIKQYVASATNCLHLKVGCGLFCLFTRNRGPASPWGK